MSEAGELADPLFAIEPEVPGGFGDGTIVVNAQAVRERKEIVPVVQNLNYRFDGWMGDDIITFSSVLAVTTSLASAIRREGLTGVQFEAMTISKSDAWEQGKLFGIDPALPEFERLIPMGTAEIDGVSRVVSWSGHDMCMGVRPSPPKNVPYFTFVVTRRFLTLLSHFQHDSCDIDQLSW